MTSLAHPRAARLPFLVAGLGLAAVSMSVILIPQGLQLALLRMEAGDGREALALLEARVAAGDRSPATMAALARARAGLGDAAGAASLLEGLVAERPRDPAALEALAEFQRLAGRTAGLLRTLEALQALAPRPDRLRELAALYGAADRRAAQREALRALVALPAAEPADYLALAGLEANMGQPQAGAAVLRALEARRPAAVDASFVGLELRLLLAAGQAEPALARGRQWLEGRRDLPLAAPILAGSLGVGGRPDFAVALLRPHVGAGADPRLVAALAQAESDAGDPGAALARLERLDPAAGQRGGVPVAILRLRLALVIGDTDRAMAAAERLGWPAVPADLRQGLTATALEAGRLDALRRLDALGEAHLAPVPVLAARLRLALDDLDGAQRWSDAATEAVIGHPELAIQLAAVDQALGRPERATSLLLGAIEDPALPPAELRGATGALLRLGQAAAAEATLAGLRQRRPSPPMDQAWALAAAAAGRGEAVAAWLAEADPSALPAALLQDLLHLAVDARAGALALQLAEQLAATRGGATDWLRLAQLLLDAGQPRRALERLPAEATAALPGDLRDALMLGAWRQGAPLAAELRAGWGARLQAAATPAERDAAIAVLIELRAHAELLPVLRSLAAQEPERWLWPHAEAATAAGRRGEAMALWAALAGRPGLPPTLRRQLAFRLLEAGDKRSAERVFRVLAAGAPADSPDMRQLLFLWGPRPAAEQLDWIEARARRATGAAEQAALMRILTDRGAPARAIALYRAAPPGTAPEPLREAYLGAVEEQGNRAAMAAALREELPTARTVPLLRRLSQIAARVGDAPAERAALERLAAAGEHSPAQQRRLAALAFRQGDDATAERLLAGLAAGGAGDHETHALLGDIAKRRGNDAAARRHHAEALRRLDAAPAQPFRSRALRASLLHRLGRDEEAVRLYEALLAERPADRDLRADYAAMLMEQGALRQARAVLAAR